VTSATFLQASTFLPGAISRLDPVEPRPGREREALMAERARIINRTKADMARLGVHGFKPHLRSAPKKLPSVQTPEGVAVPPNTRDVP
jgi:hypothetical protein